MIGRSRRRQKPAGPQSRYEIVIEKIGSEGMGIARTGTRTILVPDSLPGESLAIRISPQAKVAEIESRLSASPDRVAPPCPHYGSCGGCLLQHVAEPAYLGFQHTLITRALSYQGIADAVIRPVLRCEPETRRRATLAARNQGGRVLLGFYGKASESITDITVCPVLAPELQRLLAPLRPLLSTVLASGDKAQIHLSLADNGIDAGLILAALPGLAALEAMGDFAQKHDLARIWWRHGDAPPIPAAELRKPSIDFAGARAALPMGGFLQATQAGETALLEHVRAALGDRPASVADLFSGCGTFALPLAASGYRVHAAEADEAACHSLSQAARLANFANFTAEHRDLRVRPLTPEELNRFDAVIFDPPRAGAIEQVRMLARSKVPLIVAVSCNPASFARDAACLIEAGWSLDWVQPVDQFLWSPHIELVARFSRT